MAKALRRLLPHESTIYVGDTARAPYGSKTTGALFQYACEIIDFLLTQNVKAVVIACGTSSSTTYQPLQEQYPTLPLIDVIRPGVAACAQSPLSRFGLLATTATVKSGVFASLFQEACPQKVLHTQACPLFAPMVEAGLSHGHPAVQFAVETYTSTLKGAVDALVLGCTHYPLLTHAFEAALTGVSLINLGEAAAQETNHQLAALGMCAPPHNTPTHTYYVSGLGDVFASTGQRILGEDCTPMPLPTHHTGGNT